MGRELLLKKKLPTFCAFFPPFIRYRRSWNIATEKHWKTSTKRMRSILKRSHKLFQKCS